MPWSIRTSSAEHHLSHDPGRSSPLYQRVAAQFEEAELVALTLGVSVINTWNRLSVSFRPPVGSYQPAGIAV